MSRIDWKNYAFDDELRPIIEQCNYTEWKPFEVDIDAYGKKGINYFVKLKIFGKDVLACYEPFWEDSNFGHTHFNYYDIQEPCISCTGYRSDFMMWVVPDEAKLEAAQIRGELIVKEESKTLLQALKEQWEQRQYSFNFKE